MTDAFGSDLDGLSLDQLGDVNDRLKAQVEAESKAARGTGGVGANKFDRKASEVSSRQVQVEGEILDRLTDIHQERSERARSLDLAFEAERADDPSQWASDPSRYDWPGLDTPL